MIIQYAWLSLKGESVFSSPLIKFSSEFPFVLIEDE